MQNSNNDHSYVKDAGIDRISNLPDKVRVHFLSFLGTKEAV
jgi:hypothetical protein